MPSLRKIFFHFGAIFCQMVTQSRFKSSLTIETQKTKKVVCAACQRATELWNGFWNGLLVLGMTKVIGNESKQPT